MPLFKKSMFILVGIVLLMAAVTYWGIPGDNADEWENATAQIANPPQAEKYAVYVCGAVNKPGVVLLSSTSRVVDAVNSCGGLLPTADAEKINLAQTIKDGMQITVPEKTVAVGSNNSQENGAKVADKVNINQANVEELTKVPGVGKATAQRIIDYRTQHGPFSSIEDLKKIKGIGKAKFEKMAAKVTI